MHEDRFRRLATDYTPAIANYLRHRLYPLAQADLDDLVEESLIVVWRRIDDVPADAELPWMIGVARNVLNNARRARRRRVAMEGSLSPAAASPSAESWVLASASVREAMAALSRSDRDLLMLSSWEGLSAREIAVVLSISESAANVRLSRAHARFRDAFDTAGTP
jgi:RNA polymerase sigma-70 factor (ECF subfamily)